MSACGLIFVSVLQLMWMTRRGHAAFTWRMSVVLYCLDSITLDMICRSTRNKAMKAILKHNFSLVLSIDRFQ